MACFPVGNPQRQATQQTALARLEAALAAGTIGLRITARGSIEFRGWAEQDRDDLCDVCAYRQLTASNSAVLRKALARAEVMAGRQVDQRVIVAG